MQDKIGKAETRVVGPDTTRGIGSELVVAVVSGAVGGTAGAVATQVMNSVSKPKKKD